MAVEVLKTCFSYIGLYSIQVSLSGNFIVLIGGVTGAWTDFWMSVYELYTLSELRNVLASTYHAGSKTKLKQLKKNKHTKKPNLKPQKKILKILNN